MREEIRERLDKTNQGVVSEGYIRTKIGIYPKEWKEGQLEDIALATGGGTPKTSEAEFWTGDIPWLSSSDIKENNIFEVIPTRFINQEAISKSAAQLITGKSIAVVTRVGVGKLAYIPFKYAASQDFQNLTNIDGNAIFLTYYLSMRLRKISKKTQGTSIKGISKKTLTEMKVVLPEIDEQDKIATILSTWDKAIEKIEQLIQKKEMQKKGLMQQLLTGEARLPGFTGEWKEVKLGEVVTRKKGKAVEQNRKGKYPILGIGALNTRQFIEFTDDRRVLADKNDILLLWDGAAAGSIFTDVEGSVGSTFMRLRPKNIDSIFIREYMRRDEQYIQGIREGSGIPHIPRDFLDYYKLLLPPLPEQKAIAAILSTADQEIELLSELLVGKQEEKKGLMQLLLTGIVRV